MLTGIDVSNNNGAASRGNSIAWDRARTGLGFVIIKATQGTYFRDLEYEYNRDGCEIPNGPYHWLEPAEMYGVPNEIVDQIKWFKGKTGDLGNGSIRGSLDVETTPAQAKRRGNPSPNDIALAVDVYEQEFGHTPILYGGQPVLQPAARVRPEITRCPYWKAIYPGANNGDPAAIDRGFGLIDPWSQLAIWQWTSSGQVDGIYGRVDLDILYAPLGDILVGGVSPEVQRRKKMWALKPPWAPTLGGHSDHYRVVDAGGVAVLQGQGACTVSEVAPDPADPDHRWSAPLGAPIDQVTGFTHEDDWSILYVTFLDWHTFEYHTGERIVPQGVAGPVGPQGAPGLPGPQGAPGAPGRDGSFAPGPYTITPT